MLIEIEISNSISTLFKFFIRVNLGYPLVLKSCQFIAIEQNIIVNADHKPIIIIDLF